MGGSGWYDANVRWVVGCEIWIRLINPLLFVIFWFKIKYSTVTTHDLNVCLWFHETYPNHISPESCYTCLYRVLILTAFSGHMWLEAQIKASHKDA